MKNNYMYLGFFLVALTSFFVFYDTFQIQIWQPTQISHWVSDVPEHTRITLKFAQLGQFPVYSLWYRILNVMSGFSLNYDRLAYASITLLTALISLKYLLNYYIIKSVSTNEKLISFMAFALIFVMPILNYEHYNIVNVDNFHVYLGNISANQWHNSTLILAMPISVLLFYYSVKYVKSDKLYHFFVMSFLTVLSTLCKPNYSFAFIPILTLFIFLTNMYNRNFVAAMIKSAILALPGMLILIFQWYYTFKHNLLFDHPTKTIVAPFLVWKLYSPHLFLSLLLSITFPLVTLCIYTIKLDRYVILSWLVFIVSLAVFSVFAEYPSPDAGNFGWGYMAANYILFLFSARFLIMQSFDFKAKIAYGVFGLHFLSGCFTLGSFFYRQTSLLL